MKRILPILLIFIISAAFSQPVKPHTFSPADPVSSAKMNANFDTIYQWGSVASAAIELHKLDTAAHGATGAVMGTTNAQTVTNKTLDSSNSVDGGAIKTGTVADGRLPWNLARWGTTSLDANAIENSGFYHVNTNFPTSAGDPDVGLIHNQYSGLGSGWATQIAQSWRNGRAWIRNRENGTWEPWHEIWTTNNQGAGSGLAADTLDGYHAGTSGANVALVTGPQGYLLHDNWIRIAPNTGLFNSAGEYFYPSGWGWNLRSSSSTQTALKLQYVDGSSPGAYYSDSGGTGLLNSDYAWRLRVPHSGNLYRDYDKIIWDSGNDGSGSGLDADSVDGLHPENFFNNMGQAHSTCQDANNTGFGFRYLRTPTNGPDTGGTYAQYYGLTIGLGSDYTFDQYASQLYWPRVSQGGNPYLSVRFKDNGAWSAWSKIWAGYADSADYAGYSGRTAYLDTRSVNHNGFDYHGISMHLKANSTDGLYDGHSYHGTMHLTHWGDGSGGRAHQLAFTDNDNVWIRGFGTSWGNWYKLWHSGNHGAGSGLDADYVDGYFGRNSSSYWQIDNWLQFNTRAGLYWPSYAAGAHFYPDPGTYGVFKVIGQTNGYTGIRLQYPGVGYAPTIMYDSAGNGGVFDQGTGAWHHFYARASGNMGFGTTSPDKKIEVQAGHADTCLHLHGNINGGWADSHTYLWASEPNLTYTGSGISNNWRWNNSAGWSRENTSAGGSYIRLIDNAIYFHSVNSAGTSVHGATISEGRLSAAAAMNIPTFAPSSPVDGDIWIE